MVWILPFVLQMQQLLLHQEPVYSPPAMRAGIQGTVVLSYRIAKGGAVEDIDTVSGHPYLVAAAGTNLATWRFSAAAASAGKRRVTFVFELGDSGESKVEFKANDLVRVIAPLPSPVTKAGCSPVPVPPPAGAFASIRFCRTFAKRVLWNLPGVCSASLRAWQGPLERCCTCGQARNGEPSSDS